MRPGLFCNAIKSVYGSKVYQTLKALEHPAFGDGSMAFLTGILSRYRSDQHINRRGCVTAVRYGVLDPILSLYAAIVEISFILMGDNARSYGTVIVDDFLESKAIAGMEVSVYSLDHNSIKKVWGGPRPYCM
ncbi:hypothetical protein TNCV_1672931 [Trichonephila clavipes]|nr:hypothetical protein TNCV_1672931 [Trichonephila clavipes]